MTEKQIHLFLNPMRRPTKCGHLIFHRSCSECRALEARYYQKLSDTGFIEIEDVAHSGRRLKSWHSFRFALMVPEQRQMPEEYYNAAFALLQRHRFDKPVHKFIWTLHCEGKSQREIEIHLADSKFEKKLKRDRIQIIINKIAKEILN